MMKKILLLGIVLGMMTPFLWAQEAETPGLLEQFNNRGFKILFWDVSQGLIQIDKVDEQGQLVLTEQGTPQQRTIEFPLIILMLIVAALSLTLYFRFINIRGFKHALDIVRGRYDNEKDAGDISHFRALTSALSATVGLGNIAGVAIAISTGGPGAVFWMIASGLFGMTTKFTTCTLSQIFRRYNPDGTISGGPMHYLELGLKNRGPVLARLGKVLALLYSLLIMVAAIGGGNMYQSNQATEAFISTFELGGQAPWAIGILLALFAAMVILGGIRRIGYTTSRLVPFMMGIYMVAGIFVLAVNIHQIPSAFQMIFTMAFTQNAFFGGTLGVLIVGVQRAVFSSEAGLGSASIAHAAAKTEEPIREGLVALLEPFVDTVIICTMTALVVIVSGAWKDPNLVTGSMKGVSITAGAFATVLPRFPYILTICVGLFAFSTILSWGYYGERGWLYLVGHISPLFAQRTLIVFRIVYIAAVVVGAVHPLNSVLDFADFCILTIAFPNLIGLIFLAPTVKKKLREYWKHYQKGDFDPSNQVLDMRND